MVAGVPIALLAAKKAWAIAPDRGFALAAVGLAAMEVLGVVGAAFYLILTP